MAADDVQEEITKEYFDKARDMITGPLVLGCEQASPPMKLGFGYINPQNGIANACPVDTSLEQREFHISRCVDVLREAAQIRRDEALMRDIRMWLRRQKDEMAVLLDTIG